MHRIIDWNELRNAIYASSPDRFEKDCDPAAVGDRSAAAYQRATRGEKRATARHFGERSCRNPIRILACMKGDVHGTLRRG